MADDKQASSRQRYDAISRLNTYLAYHIIARNAQDGFLNHTMNDATSKDNSRITTAEIIKCTSII